MSNEWDSNEKEDFFEDENDWKEAILIKNTYLNSKNGPFAEFYMNIGK